MRLALHHAGWLSTVLRPIIEHYIFEDRISASRRSGYARRGGQSPPYGKSLNSHELCKAQ